MNPMENKKLRDVNPNKRDEFEMTDQIRVGLLIEDLDEQIKDMCSNRHMRRHYTHEFKLFRRAKVELESYLKKLSES